MNSVYPLLVLAAVGVAVAYGNVRLPDSKPAKQIAVQPKSDPDPRQEKKEETRDYSVWVMTNLQNRAACLIYKSHHISGNSTRIDVDQACEDVFQGSSYVQVWNEHNKNQLFFMDATGSKIIDFARDEKMQHWATSSDQWTTIVLFPDS